MMDAANSVHSQYFGQQQAAERNFLAKAEAHLCNADVADGDGREYQRRLHTLLTPLRDAIARHTHAAFFIKDVCIQAVPSVPHIEW